MSRGSHWSLGEGGLPTAQAAGQPATLDDAFAPGAVIAGSYRLGTVLGRGASGVVFRADQLGVGRSVAVKVLSRSCNSVLRERLLREGQLAASLQHPGIGRVFSAGEWADHPYLVYELLEDCQTLGEVFRSLSREEALRILREVAEAVAYAHAQGVVHRDVKPDNVLLDADGHARVIDFGLARTEEQSRLTQTGALVGTPIYMAPECFASSRVGPPADVWALGVMLFEALSGGELPFEGASLIEQAQATVNAPLPSLRSRDPSISRELEGLTRLALARDVAERYPDAGAFAEDLARALRGEPISRRPMPRPGALLVLASGALIAVGLFVLTLLARETPSRSGPKTTPETSPPHAAAHEPQPAPVLGSRWPVPPQEVVPASDPDLQRYLKAADGTLEELQLAERLAARGHPLALRDCGQSFLSGVYFPADPENGYRLLRRALKHGEPSAAAILTTLFLDEDTLPLHLRLISRRQDGAALGLRADQRLAAALALLGTQPGTQAADTCQQILDATGVSPPATRAEAYALVQAVFEPASEHWPSRLPTWPLSNLLQFTDAENRALDAADLALDNPASRALIVALAARDHPRALRRRAWQLMRTGDERNPGAAFHMLWRALEHGSALAASELGLFYLPDDGTLPPEAAPAQALAEELGILPDPRASAALLVLAPERRRYPLIQDALEASLANEGIPLPTADQAYAYLEELWKPLAIRQAERQAVMRLNATVRAWIAADPELAIFQASLAGLSEGELLAKARTHAAKEELPGELRRLVIVWRQGTGLGYTWAQANLAELLERGREAVQLDPAPWPVLFHNYLRLAEQGEHRAVFRLSRLLSYPEISDGAVEKDLVAAGAWLSLAAALSPDRAALEKGRFRVLVADAETPASTSEAWKIVRSRWPPRLRAPRASPR